MSQNTTYSDLLRDPRWQRKRLEILNAANWSCQCCGCEDEELHVHHCVYKQGKKPWEYPDDSLMVLCKSCHNEHHNKKNQIIELMGSLALGDIEVAIGFMKALRMFSNCRGAHIPSEQEAFGFLCYVRHSDLREEAENITGQDLGYSVGTGGEVYEVLTEVL